MAIEHLSKKLYHVSVPLVSVMSDRELEVRGVPIMHNALGEVVDPSEQFISSWQTIEQLLNIFTMGYRITLIDQSECKDIYDKIQDHINGRTRPVVTSMNSRITEDDSNVLADLDMFAGSIYDNNVDSIANATVNPMDAFGLGMELINNSNTASDKPKTRSRYMPKSITTDQGDSGLYVPRPGSIVPTKVDKAIIAKNERNLYRSSRS